MENFLKKLEMPEIVDMLSEGLCSSCKDLLQTRLQNLFSDNTNGKFNGKSLSSGNHSENSSDFCSANTSSLCSPEKSFASSTNGPHQQESSSWSSTRTPGSVHSSKRQGHVTSSSPASVSSRQQSLDRLDSKVAQNDTFAKSSNGVSNEQVVQKGLSLSPEQEQIRFSQVGRKKDFVYFERVNGKKTNVLQGLELHTRVFNTMEQEKIVDYVYKLQRTGQNGQLKERTYTEPKKWMRGKGRVTIQFGCCYNYAVDKNGNPPGIVRDEEVDPIPPLFKAIIKRLVRWNVLPVTCVPNSCIVNIYDEGDCIPPHIDHHDFLRPFCTVSFLTECNILFGSNLKIEGAGEFSGPVAIPLPVGSVLILNGNGADIAKHCVPGVPAKRISITFRKMDDSKLPYKFKPDPELQGIQPYSLTKLPKQQVKQAPPLQQTKQPSNDEVDTVKGTSKNSFHFGQDDFPPLGASASTHRPKTNKHR